MVQDEQLIGPKRELSVRTPLIVGELDFERRPVELVDDGSDLAPYERVLGKVLEQRNDIEDVDRSVSVRHRRLTTRSTR